MKLLFMGRKWSGAEALKWSIQAGFEVIGVITDQDNPQSATARIARSYNIPLLRYEDVVARAKAGLLTVDLAVSFVFWKIIKKPLLNTPKFGIINFHPAPLPDYKGTAGYNIAILEELERWAVTAHYMDEGIDTGGIIDSFDFSIDPLQETAQTLEQTSQEFMLRLYKKTMRRALAMGGLLPTRPNRGGRYISRKEMEAMKRIRPGDNVDKKIRAFWFPPYQGAFIDIEGKKYTLVNEEILATLAKNPAPPTGLAAIKPEEDVQPVRSSTTATGDAETETQELATLK